jgi:ABC-type sugar transport system ATPase subunit
MPTSDRELVSMQGISKKYANVRALSNVDLILRQGEVVSLVGDNGAGKSTLIKILCGAVRADSGSIAIEGRHVDITKPSVALSLGISVIYQDLALFNNLSASENIYAGRELIWRICGIPFVRQKKMLKESQAVLERLGIVTMASTRGRAGDLSGGQRQMIAVARAIGVNSRVMVLDEPTAALGVRETRVLLDLVQSLRDAGLAILFVTHRIPDAMMLSNRIVVLKGGEVQGEMNPASCELDDVIELIVRGRKT